jgi:hypothetical protein
MKIWDICIKNSERERESERENRNAYASAHILHRN